MSEPILVVIDTHGIYIPQIFAKTCRESFYGVLDAEWDILLEGPDHEEYWDTWDSVINNAKAYETDWVLYQDGDLWLVPPDYDHEKKWA